MGLVLHLQGTSAIRSTRAASHCLSGQKRRGRSGSHRGFSLLLIAIDLASFALSLGLGLDIVPVIILLARHFG